MKLNRELQLSFAGGVNDSQQVEDYAADQATMLINCRPTLLGTGLEPVKFWERVIGNVGAQNWYGVIEFETAAGVKQLVVMINAALYYSVDDGVTFTLGGSTGENETYVSFAIIREGSTNILCIAGGWTSCYQWDGTTLSTISGIPSGTKYLAVHGNRLIAAGGSGVQVSASKVGDIDTWAAPDGWVVPASTHDGDTEVTGLYTLGPIIMVLKRKSVGYIEGFGYTTLQVETGARGISRSVGCVGHRTIAAAGDQGVMWLSERGFERYILGSSTITLMSRLQQSFVRGINYDLIAAYPTLPFAVWWPKRQEYICAVPVAVGFGALGGNGSSLYDIIPERGTVNTWFWCCRVGNPELGERPAVYMVNLTFPPGETGNADDSLTIDANGELDILTEDLSGYMATLRNGALDVCRLPEPGQWVHTYAKRASGARELSMASDHGTFGGDFPSALCVADFRGEGGELVGCGASLGSILYWGSGIPADDAAASYTAGGPFLQWARSRLMAFGDPHTRKKAKRIHVFGRTRVAATPQAGLVIDGEAQALASMAFAADDGVLQTERIRCGGRGYQMQIDYQSSDDDMTVDGFELDAQVLEDEP